MRKGIFFSGFSGGFGNRFLQHIDAALHARESKKALISSHWGCMQYIDVAKPSIPIRFINRKWALSEVLFDSRLESLDGFLRFPPRQSLHSSTVALHFRGRDFAIWKSHSIIHPSWFIDCLSEDIAKGSRILLVTDDPAHENVDFLFNELRAQKANIKMQSSNFRDDFKALYSARKLIASPSTFSLAAATLGGRNITFPRSYAEIEAEDGSQFWRKALAKSNNHLNICFQ